MENASLTSIENMDDINKVNLIFGNVRLSRLKICFLKLMLESFDKCCLLKIKLCNKLCNVLLINIFYKQEHQLKTYAAKDKH